MSINGCVSVDGVLIAQGIVPAKSKFLSMESDHGELWYCRRGGRKPCHLLIQLESLMLNQISKLKKLLLSIRKKKRVAVTPYPHPPVPDFSWEFAEQLRAASKYHEGTLLSGPSKHGRASEIKSQVDFLLRMVKPGNRVLEIGTNCGHFTYLALLIGAARVDTIEIDSRCLPAIDILRGRFGERISAHLGDSDNVLKQWSSKFQFDIAWVDGNHNSVAALKDLQHCERFGIPLILVDDYDHHGVCDAVHQFIDHSPYYISSTSGRGAGREAIALEVR